VARRGEVLQWIRDFDELEVDLQKAHSNQLVSWRRDRNKLSGAFRDSSLPAALAKCYADFLHSLATFEGAELDKLRQPSLVQADAGKAMFLKALFWPNGSHQAACNPWFDQMQTLYSQHAAALLPKIVAIAQRIATKTAHHNTTLLEPEEWSNKFDWNCSADPRLKIDFNSPKDTKPVLHVMHEMAYDGRYVAWPWYGQRSFVQVVHGNVLVTLLDSSIVGDKGDVHGWLKTAHHTQLQSGQTFYLQQQDILYIPPAKAALFCGVPEEGCAPNKRIRGKGSAADEDFVKKYAAFVVYLSFSSLDQELSADKVNYIATSYVKGLNWVPASIRAIATDWKASLEKSMSDAPAEADAKSA